MLMLLVVVLFCLNFLLPTFRKVIVDSAQEMEILKFQAGSLARENRRLQNFIQDYEVSGDGASNSHIDLSEPDTGSGDVMPDLQCVKNLDLPVRVRTWVLTWFLTCCT